MSVTGLGGHTVKHDATYSTTTTCSQVWEDVTAESQAFQPEKGAATAAQSKRREKKGKPNTTEHLSILHSVL